MDLPSQYCVVLEDSTHGIEAAYTANMIPIGISTTNPEDELFDKGAKTVVERLDEINLSILHDLVKSMRR